MKKITTVLAMIALAFTLSTLAFGQQEFTGGKGIQGGITKGRQSTATPTGSVTFGKVKAPQAKLQSTSRKEFDKGYLPPNASRGYRGTTTVNQGNNIINWGDGNNTLRSAKVQRQNKAGQPNQLSGFGEDLLQGRGGRGHGQPNQLTDFGPTNASRKIVGSPEYFNSYSKPKSNLTRARHPARYRETDFNSYSKSKSNLTATTYGRGSFAKTRGKQGR